MLIVCIFLVRAAFVFIGFFSNWSFVSYFDLVYYGCTEVLPISAMFFILLYRSPAAAAAAAARSDAHANQFAAAALYREETSSGSYDERTPIWKKQIV